METEKRNLFINVALSSVIFVLGILLLVFFNLKTFGLFFIFTAILLSFITVIRISKGQLYTNNLLSINEREVHHHHHYKNENTYENENLDDYDNEK